MLIKTHIQRVTSGIPIMKSFFNSQNKLKFLEQYMPNLINPIHSLFNLIELHPNFEHHDLKNNIKNAKTNSDKAYHIYSAEKLTNKYKGGSFFGKIGNFFKGIGHGIVKVAKEAVPVLKKIGKFVLPIIEKVGAVALDGEIPFAGTALNAVAHKYLNPYIDKKLS